MIILSHDLMRKNSQKYVTIFIENFIRFEILEDVSQKFEVYCIETSIEGENL